MARRERNDRNLCGLGYEEDFCIVLCFISPYFECIVKKTGFAGVVVAEAKKLRVRDCFLAISCKLLAIKNLEKTFFYWSRRIPLGCHASVVVGKVLGGDCSIFIPEFFGELDRSAATKFRDWVFESDEKVFRAVICNHRDK